MLGYLYRHINILNTHVTVYARDKRLYFWTERERNVKVFPRPVQHISLKGFPGGDLVKMALLLAGRFTAWKVFAVK